MNKENESTKESTPEKPINKEPILTLLLPKLATNQLLALLDVVRRQGTQNEAILALDFIAQITLLAAGKMLDSTKNGDKKLSPALMQKKKSPPIT